MFEEGARLTQLVDQGEVQALAVWRVFHTTYCGRRLEIEDLVTSSSHRSKGYGATLLHWLEGRGRALNCTPGHPELGDAPGRRPPLLLSNAL